MGVATADELLRLGRKALAAADWEGARALLEQARTSRRPGARLRRREHATQCREHARSGEPYRLRPTAGVSAGAGSRRAMARLDDADAPGLGRIRRLRLAAGGSVSRREESEPSPRPDRRGGAQLVVRRPRGRRGRDRTFPGRTATKRCEGSGVVPPLARPSRETAADHVRLLSRRVRAKRAIRATQCRLPVLTPAARTCRFAGGLEPSRGHPSPIRPAEPSRSYLLASRQKEA
jgi:hypothetical protein